MNPIKVEELEVCLSYYSKGGKEVQLFDLLYRHDAMDLDAYVPINFWCSMGGIEIVINGYLTIFHSCNFYVFVKITNFLIHSVYWVKGVSSSDWFDIDDEYPNDVVLRTMAKEILRIEKVEGEILSLSFIAKEKDHIRQRSERYFRNIKFSKDQWVTAVTIALDEYFKVLKELLKRHPDGEGISPMIKYVELCEYSGAK